jgi:hypothetical protein
MQFGDIKDYRGVIIVCGSRYYDDSRRMEEALATVHPEVTIVSGGARGADSLARLASLERGLFFIEIPARWDYFGAQAGPIRNANMLKVGLTLATTPDKLAVLAFHENIQNSKGTRDMVFRALSEDSRIAVINITKQTMRRMSLSGIKGAI